MEIATKSIHNFHSLDKFKYSWCIVLCAFIIVGESAPNRKNDEEIEIYRQYLRIPTVHPNVDYKPAVAFLTTQAANTGLPVSIYYPADQDNPVVVMTWEGSQPELPSIILNSHMDVVPVFEEYWIHPPFAAEMEENGDIYARGSQDTKNLGMQYLAAIRSLKQKGIDRLKRTIHVVFVPDEEVGGTRGMGAFCKSDAFRAMNVGFVLDEGNSSPNETLPASYVERSMWEIELTFHGKSGHGSMLFEDTPGEKLNYVVNKLMEYRKEEQRKLNELHYPYGNVTSINLTILKGGVQSNVIPAEMSATFDFRVSVNTDIDEFQQQINHWCEEAGGNITIKTLVHPIKEIPTLVDDSNPFWVAMKTAFAKIDLKVEPIIRTTNTDMRHIRNLNIPAIGFAPMINTEPRKHAHNEFLNADVYLFGIEVYTNVVRELGNVNKL